MDSKIDGVVLTLIDIDPLERTISDLEEARNLAQAVTESNHEPLAVLTEKLVVKVANQAFYALVETGPEQVLGRPVLELLPHGAQEQLRTALAEVLPQKKSFTGLKLMLSAAHGGGKEVSINGRQIFSAKRTYPFILLSWKQLA